ncbi:MAG: DUF3575 domain-containing protein [Alistipes putredinis]
MKHYLLIIVSLFTFSVSHAQFSSVSTNIVGWAAGNINAAVDLNVNLHNTINIPVSANPFKFGDTQWSHVVLQPGWRHWFVERYIGQFVSPSLFYANYTIGYDKRTFKGNAYGIGCSWGYSKLLSTRWNFIVEIGAGIVYTPTPRSCGRSTSGSSTTSIPIVTAGSCSSRSNATCHFPTCSNSQIP